MRALPLTDVKARLSEIAEEVSATHERVRVTRNGRDYVVLMAASDLEELEATLELLADPDAVREIEQSRQELDAGGGTTADEMRALLARGPASRAG